MPLELLVQVLDIDLLIVNGSPNNQVCTMTCAMTDS